MKHIILEERLIDFATQIIKMVEQLPDRYLWRHLGSQIIRSSTSVALNYGEAQVAESKADFIHKMRICLKELKETSVCLQIMQRNHESNENLFRLCIQETSELIAIFVSSINTTRRNEIAKKG